MVTKYTTGQSILIPATIEAAEERDGKIIYQVRANTWEGIPEDAIVLNDNAQVQAAMETFMEQFKQDNDWR